MRFHCVSSLLLVLASTAVPIQAQAISLTPDSFPQTATGLWFIEFFSPYCPHCRKFAPTWEQLVAESDLPFLNFAQVDCSVHGDLCNDQDVPGYPTLRMYSNGQRLPDYLGSRNLPALHRYIDDQVLAVTPKPNPDGQLLSLTDKSFASTLAQGPMFVKFFAPWCGHCKKLAPVWKQLAHEMKNKLNIVQVDCEANPALCKAHNIQGYPTLVYMSTGGINTEYNGGRKLDQLKAFADNAASAGLHPIQPSDLESLVAEHQVMYLLVHSDNSILDTAARAAAILLGSPSVFTVSDPTLLARFSIPHTSTWALLVFKDHDVHVPAAILHEQALAPENSLRKWFLEHRLPTALELTQDTFQGVMNAPHAPLVVIAAVTSANSDQVAKRIQDVAKKWRLRTKGSGVTGHKEVVWAWMDAEKWKDWMKSMYGIVAEQDADWDDVPVVVTDHKRLVYYDRDPANKRLKVSSSKSLFETVEAAAAGKLPYKHSENFVERVARYLNMKMMDLQVYVATYPWRAAFILCMIFVAIFFALKRLLADDVPGDYRKVDRLD